MKIFIFDSESYQDENGNPKFGLAVAKEFNKDNFIYFHNVNDVKDWILHGDPKHIYMHNGLNFDIELIFGYKELLNHKLIFNNAKLYHAIINKSYIYDTYLLFRTSLKKIGEDLGLIKGSLQKELAIMKKDEFYKRIDEIEKYCENDVIILENALNWLFNFVNYYGIKKYYKYLTIASLSFSLISKIANFRLSLHQTKNKNIKVINPMHHLFLLSYFGGRTEAFYNGIFNGQFYTYDFNSLYPSCFNLPFPNRFLYAKINPSDEELTQVLLGNYEGIGFFDVYAPKNVFGFYDDKGNFIDIGLLPYRDKKQNKIIYPVGHFYGWYNFPEIRYAISHGYKIKAISLYVFDRIYYNNIYNVITQFYKLRKTDPKNSTLYKLMINSFYGKFGEKHQNEMYITPEQEENLIYDYDHYKYITQLDNDNNIKYIIIKDLKYSLSNHTDFSIASYITTYSRIKLLNKFEEVIKNNGKIFYCDTDSIFTNIVLPSNNEIGNVKLEHEGIKLKLKGQKNYEITTKDGEIIKKKKGVNKDALLIDELGDDDETEIYEYEHILPFKSGVKKFDDLTKIKETKKIRNTYKRQKGKEFLQVLELNSPNVLINENIKWKFDSLKEYFEYVNIYYPYKENFEIHYY
ncbi:MAG: DNA polymerase [Thermoplasmata archaeon]